jgi:cytochrome c553
MRKTLSISTAFGVCLIAMSAHAAPVNDKAADAAAASKVTTVCQNCHGPNGDSTSATFPRLNGQQSGYIAAQLKTFRSHSRDDPHAMAYMWGMASQLDDASIIGIANYLARQKPTEAQTGGSLAAAGKNVYMNGVEADNVPPCAACHGDHGEGNGEMPRLAGQHADYLKKQLEDFRSLVRTNDIMHANTKNMTDRDIESVVSYLANE